MNQQDKLERIADGVSKIKVDIAEIRIILKQNTGDMKKHIRRTDVLQEEVSKFRTMLRTMMWLAGGVISLIAVAETTLNIFKMAGK